MPGVRAEEVDRPVGWRSRARPGAARRPRRATSVATARPPISRATAVRAGAVAVRDHDPLALPRRRSAGTAHGRCRWLLPSPPRPDPRAACARSYREPRPRVGAHLLLARLKRGAAPGRYAGMAPRRPVPFGSARAHAARTLEPREASSRARRLGALAGGLSACLALSGCAVLSSLVSPLLRPAPDPSPAALELAHRDAEIYRQAQAERIHTLEREVSRLRGDLRRGRERHGRDRVRPARRADARRRGLGAGRGAHLGRARALQRALAPQRDRGGDGAARGGRASVPGRQPRLGRLLRLARAAHRRLAARGGPPRLPRSRARA